MTGQVIKKQPALLTLLLCLVPFAAGALDLDELTPFDAIKVEIRGGPGSYVLYRNDEVYRIRGAGAGLVRDVGSLPLYGANSFRTWSASREALDTAYKLGLTVSLGLDVQRERHGFDYNDKKAVKKQFREIRKIVWRLRYHPALLTWVIGNELNLGYTNPAVYDAVNDISKMIHRFDPNHPTTTTTAGIDQKLATVIAERAPDIDFLSIQFYGAIRHLATILEGVHYGKPMMVTEWGTEGHWEVPKTEWGAPIELSSSEKAKHFLESWEDSIHPLAGKLIGDYVFLWGQKQERTPTWYGLFTPEGERTEAIDVMQHIWTGRYPPNRAPGIRSLLLNNRTVDKNVTLAPGVSYPAEVLARDPERDPLSYRWRLMRESTATQTGGDAEETPEDLSHLVKNQGHGRALVTAPVVPGAYRLFVYVVDTEKGAGHVNMPFLVANPGSN